MTKIVFSSALKSVTGGESQIFVEFTGDIESLLNVLRDRYGETLEKRLLDNGALRRYVNVYVDGKDIRFLDGVKTAIGTASEVLFLPAVSGG